MTCISMNPRHKTLNWKRPQGLSSDTFFSSISPRLGKKKYKLSEIIKDILASSSWAQGLDYYSWNSILSLKQKLN